MAQDKNTESIEARGRSADILPYDDGRVIKLFLPDFPKDMIDLECENTIEAHALGCTSMNCYGKVEVDGRTGIILDWVAGVPMTKAAEKSPGILFKSGKLLADQHVLVHSKHSEKLRDARTASLAFLDDEPLQILTEVEREKAKHYIASLPEGNTVLHLDFHTENIMVDGTDCVTIDWLTAARGFPEVEIGVMDYLFHYGLLFPGASKLQIAFYSTVRTFVYDSYLRHYLMATGIKIEDVKKWKIISLIFRRRVWAHADEAATLTDQIKACIAELPDS